jgi:outer membrane lipoprotein-sorting protein
MQARILTRGATFVALGAAISAGLATAVLAQGAKAPAAPEWTQTVTKEPAGEFDSKQLDIIQKLTSYFNDMGEMKGKFEQTSPDGKRLRGQIFVKRPSFRFEYNRPSRQLIISDGKYMIIQDLDLKTDDRWGLDKTPFRVILSKNVDLLRDSKVLEVGETDDRLYISLQDKTSDVDGRLKLLFMKKPAIEFKEWITTDRQGLETKVELNEFTKAAEPLDDKLFVPPQIILEKLQR